MSKFPHLSNNFKVKFMPFNKQFWLLVFINQVPYIVLYATRGFSYPCSFMSRLILTANLILVLNSSFHIFSFFSIFSDLFIWAVHSKLLWHWHRFHPNHITPLPCERLTKCSSRRENISVITTNLKKESGQKKLACSSGASERWKSQETSWLCSTFNSLLIFYNAVSGPWRCYWAASLGHHLQSILIRDVYWLSKYSRGYSNVEVPANLKWTHLEITACNGHSPKTVIYWRSKDN